MAHAQTEASKQREKQVLGRLMTAKGKDLQALDDVQLSLMKERCILLDENDTPLRPATKIELHLRENMDGSIGKPLLHRAFSVFLFDAQGRVLLQKRADSKITYPAFWANTCCSHPWYTEEEMAVGEGDSLPILGAERAARRKLLQELGIDADALGLDFHFVTRIHYRSFCDDRGDEVKPAGKGDDEEGEIRWGEHEIDYILLAQAKDDIPLDKLNPNEVQDARFFSPDELESFLASNVHENKGQKGAELISPWFRLISTISSAGGAANEEEEKGKRYERSGLLWRWWDNLEDVKKGKLKDEKTIHRFGTTEL